MLNQCNSVSSMERKDSYNPKSMILKKYIFLLIALGLYLCMRLFVLFSSPYSYDEWPEEAMLVVGKEIMSNGFRFNLFDLQYNPYQGGMLLVTLLLLPLYKIFGVSVFSLQLLGFFFSALTFVLIYPVFLATVTSNRVFN